jgi:hypothetical protein
LDHRLAELEKTALWLIIDPWKRSPYERDYLIDPSLDEHNEEVLLKILNYLPRLNHVLVSCNVFEHPQPILHPLVAHLTNINNSHDLLMEYVVENNITDICYMGFHHGQCILYKEIGAQALSEKTHLRLHIKRDLVSVLKWNDELDADRRSLCYADFI